jgi:hypothetical protein
MTPSWTPSCRREGVWRRGEAAGRADGGAQGVRGWAAPDDAVAVFVAVTACVCVTLSVPKQLASRGSREDVQAVALAIAQHRASCMLVFDGEPILYHTATPAS